MNRTPRLRQSILDRSGARFCAALVLASIGWIAVLYSMLMHLSGNSPPPRLPEQTALDMKMVLLTAPQVVISNAAQAWVAPPAQALLHKPEHVRLTQKLPVQPREIPLRRVETQSLQPPQETHPGPVSEAPSTLPETSSASANGVNKSAATNTASTAPSAMKGSAARIIAQPLPELPDDLREAAYRADALARFFVHVDGNVDVELLKATPYPRLNQMLLEALRKWRFFLRLKAVIRWKVNKTSVFTLTSAK